MIVVTCVRPPARPARQTEGQQSLRGAFPVRTWVGVWGCPRTVCKAAREIEVYEVRTAELLQRQIINLR